MKNIITAAVLATLAGVFFNPIVQQSRHYNRCVELMLEGEMWGAGRYPAKITDKNDRYISATRRCRGY